MNETLINQINLINATKISIKKSKSRTYKQDKLRYLERLYKELQVYYRYSGLDYKQIRKEIEECKIINTYIDSLEKENKLLKKDLEVLEILKKHYDKDFNKV